MTIKLARGYGTEDQREPPREAPTLTGVESIPPWSWEKITHYISTVEGAPISRQRSQKVAETALAKLRRKLHDDPVIREWLAEQGYILRDEV